MLLSIPWLSSSSPVSPATLPGPKPPLAEQLTHYSRGGGQLPPSARVTPDKKQQLPAPASLTDLWRYGAFVAAKARELATDFVYHHVYGPRRKSWGIEMTLISSFMRNMGTATHLADINMLRMLMQLGGMVPLPADALVTPVTFRVRRRGLRGILAEFDALEDGTRELSGEWIVGKKLWQRLNADWKHQQQHAHSPQQQKQQQPNGKKGQGAKHRVILYLHGGAYYLFSAATHRLITIPLSKYTDARVFGTSLDYRLAPETRFPGPLHDAVSAYFRLTDDLGIPPENILIAGDSAGGGLSTALLMYLRDNNYPLPAGTILFSPWVDLTMSCDSWDSNAEFDIVPRPISGDHLDPIGCYLGEDIQRYLTHPYASPLFGDFTGLPPMLVQAGEAEVLRDEITLFAHKATMAGVQVQHELFEDAVHVFQTFPFLDLTREAFMSCRNFVRHVLPMHQRHSPRVLDNRVEGVLENETGNAQSKIVRGDGLEEAPATELPARPSEEDLSPSAIRRASTTGSTDEEDPSWEYAPDKVDVQVEVYSSSETESEGEGPDPGTTSDDDPHRLHAFPTSPTFPSSGPPSPHAPPPIRRAISSLSRFYGGRVPAEHQSRTKKLSLHLPAGKRRDGQPAPASLTLDLDLTMPVSPPPHSARRAPALSLVSTEEQSAPQPSVRRMRTKSHADISALCSQWAQQGPANKTITYRA
ncbi:hypothetical protein AURDEDRAFT_179911 [Auricularia subglabra TFB-10046 SS5]|nr:hypothetical protein AURDEDRAFT_179911 [Auricularia subglabra TFB-10046 SS5]